MRVISWVAVSSKPQYEKESPAEQRAENERVAKLLGGHIVAVLEVPGESRSIVEFVEAERQILAYRQLRQLINARAADLLICRDLSRLGRKKALVSQVISLCLDAGIAIYPTTAPPRSLTAAEQAVDEGLMWVSSMSGTMAEVEVMKLRRRHAFGIAARVRSGKMPGKTPYGYRKRHEDDSYVVNQGEAVKIRSFVHHYLEYGKSLKKAAQAAGLPNPSTAKNIVNRIWVYAGYAQVNQKTPAGRQLVRAKGSWEPLITDDAAAAVEAEAKRRSKARRGVDSPLAFSGILQCAHCHVVMKSEGVQKMRHGKKRRPFIIGCARHERSYRCESCNHGIGENKVRLSLLFFLGLLRTQSEFEKILEMCEQDGFETMRNEVASIRDAIKKEEARRDRLTKALIDGLLDGDMYAKYNAEIQASLATFRNMLLPLETEMTRRDTDSRRRRLEQVAEEGIEMLNSMYEDQRRFNAWLHSFINSIVIDPEESIVRQVDLK